MKTLYLKQSIHLQQEFAKYMAFILNAIYCKLLIKFNETGHLRFLWGFSENEVIRYKYTYKSHL